MLYKRPLPDRAFGIDKQVSLPFDVNNEIYLLNKCIYYGKVVFLHDSPANHGHREK
jgi:hypothetical protein